MSRVIKFRQPVLNRDGKFIEWHYWGMVDDGWVEALIHLSTKQTRTESQQFTGLTDKNGKEIYEGDVVRLISGGSRWNREACEVVFLNGSFQFNRPDWSYPCGFITYAMSCSERYIIDDHSELCSQIEVIGNIHENPELI